ncbi:MAG: DUF4136 domain-containing protein [Novosphingobium sp.]
MKSKLLAPLVAVLALSACVAPTGPIEVTRFHVPDVSQLGKGSIAVEPGTGMDGKSLELQTYMGAVHTELQRLGHATAASGSGDQVALVRLSRQRIRPARSGGPVSVGIGGSTGSYGSGLGLGIGLNLSGAPAEQVETELAVAIKDRRTDKILWEGRAAFTVRASSPLAQTQLGAPKMASALFAGFPGNSGETITVR